MILFLIFADCLVLYSWHTSWLSFMACNYLSLKSTITNQIYRLRSCYWYNEGNNPEDQVQKYFDLLGSDWRTSRVFGGISASLSFYYFCYLLSYICSSQVRGVRYFNIFFSAIVLTGFQGLTFLVFTSKVCEENGCTFSRAAGFSVAAMTCSVIAGLSFFLSKDSPGERLIAGRRN